MTRNKKNKHNFWKRLHFKYRLSVMNENTLEEIWKIRASIFSGAALVGFFAVFLIAITSIIIIATPIRYYLPGYLDTEIRESAIRAAMRADSLEQQISYQQAYITNLQDIFSGKRQIDSVKIIDTVSISANDSRLLKTENEKNYTKQYEESEKYNLSAFSSTSTPVEGAIFFKPIKGIIVNKFNPSNEDFGITIKTSAKESVLATLDGTVVSAGYEVNSGYTIQIQHKNGFFSIYKNNTMLLKKSGDKVRTGEAIAITGKEKDDERDSLFHFELWYRGSAINPENYISF